MSPIEKVIQWTTHTDPYKFMKEVLTEEPEEKKGSVSAKPLDQQELNIKVQKTFNIIDTYIANHDQAWTEDSLPTLKELQQRMLLLSTTTKCHDQNKSLSRRIQFLDRLASSRRNQKDSEANFDDRPVTPSGNSKFLGPGYQPVTPSNYEDSIVSANPETKYQNQPPSPFPIVLPPKTVEERNQHLGDAWNLLLNFQKKSINNPQNLLINNINAKILIKYNPVVVWQSVSKPGYFAILIKGNESAVACLPFQFINCMNHYLYYKPTAAEFLKSLKELDQKNTAKAMEGPS